jgi:hypothetical protein
VTLALAVGAVAATVGLGGWWVGRGADGPLLRGNPEVLPAFVAAAASEPDQVRTLVLQRDGEQLVYSLLRSDSPQLGDAETGPPADALRGLDAAVSEVASGRGGTAVDDLRRYAVRYLLVAAPVDPTLESTLDSVPGLVRVANPGSDALWQLQQRTGRLALLAPRVAGAGQAELTVLPSGALAADTPVVAGPGGRALLLAENADRGWVATLDGTDLHRSTAGWQQTFAVPSAGGELVLRYDGSSRTRWLFVEGLFLLAAVVVAIPGRRDEEKGSL